MHISGFSACILKVSEEVALSRPIDIKNVLIDFFYSWRMVFWYCAVLMIKDLLHYGQLIFSYGQSNCYCLKCTNLLVMVYGMLCYVFNVLYYVTQLIYHYQRLVNPRLNCGFKIVLKSANRWHGLSRARPLLQEGRTNNEQ